MENYDPPAQLRCLPVAIREIAAFAGVLDHTVQRDALDDFELSHWNLRVEWLNFTEAMLPMADAQAPYAQCPAVSAVF